MLKKIRKLLKQQEGFTLVELMIVVVILGILSGIGIQQYGRIQDNAKKAAHEANHRIIKSAVQMYLMTADSLPALDTINLEIIKKAGYLDSQIVNPYTNTDNYKIAIEEGEVSGAYIITVTPSIEEPTEEPTEDPTENPTGGTSSNG